MSAILRKLGWFVIADFAMILFFVAYGSLLGLLNVHLSFHGYYVLLLSLLVVLLLPATLLWVVLRVGHDENIRFKNAENSKQRKQIGSVRI